MMLPPKGRDRSEHDLRSWVTIQLCFVPYHINIRRVCTTFSCNIRRFRNESGEVVVLAAIIPVAKTLATSDCALSTTIRHHASAGSFSQSSSPLMPTDYM